MLTKLLTVIATPAPRVPWIEWYLGSILIAIAIKGFRDRTNHPFEPAELKPEKFEPYWETLK